MLHYQENNGHEHAAAERGCGRPGFRSCHGHPCGKSSSIAGPQIIFLLNVDTTTSRVIVIIRINAQYIKSVQ